MANATAAADNFVLKTNALVNAFYCESDNSNTDAANGCDAPNYNYPTSYSGGYSDSKYDDVRHQLPPFVWKVFSIIISFN